MQLNHQLSGLYGHTIFRPTNSTQLRDTHRLHMSRLPPLVNSALILGICSGLAIRHKGWIKKDNQAARVLNTRLQVMLVIPPPQLHGDPLGDVAHLFVAGCETTVTKRQGSTTYKKLKSRESTEAYFLCQYMRSPTCQRILSSVVSSSGG